MRGRGASFQDGVAAGKGHLGNWPRDPAVSMRSELLVAHEKLGQLLLLLTVYVVPM